MFQTDEDIQSAIATLYGRIADLERGDVLAHAVVREVVGCRPHEGSYDHVVKMVRQRLEKERGIATWPVTDVGYRLLTVDEQLTMLPRKRLRKSLRQVQRAKHSVQRLPDKGLSLHDRRRKAFDMEFLKAAESDGRRELRAMDAGPRPTPVPVRRPAVFAVRRDADG